MFSILVFVLQACMFVSLFVMIPALLAVRIVMSIKYQETLKERLYVVLMPFSIGILSILDNELRLVKLYKKLLVIFTVLAIIGILFTIYQTLI